MVIFLFLLIAVPLLAIGLVIYTIARIATVSETTRDLMGKDEIEHNPSQFQAFPTDDFESRPEQNSNLIVIEDPYLDSPEF